MECEEIPSWALAKPREYHRLRFPLGQHALDLKVVSDSLYEIIRPASENFVRDQIVKWIPRVKDKGLNDMGTYRKLVGLPLAEMEALQKSFPRGTFELVPVGDAVEGKEVEYISIMKAPGRHGVDELYVIGHSDGKPVALEYTPGGFETFKKTSDYDFQQLQKSAEEFD